MERPMLKTMTRATIAVALFSATFLVAAPAARAQDDDARRQKYQDLIKRGCDELTAGDFEKSTATFLAAIEVDEEDPTAYYNLACVCSREGKKGEAVDWLRKSIARGWDDADYIDKDSDLDAIRGERAYQELMQRSFGRRPAPRPAAPPQGLSTLDGKPARIGPDPDGGLTIVLLWRTWSEPCRHTAQALAEIAQAASAKLRVVAVSDEPAADLQGAADELKLPFALLHSEGPLTGPIFEGVREVFPTILILDAEGAVRKKLVGGRSKDDLATEIEAARKPRRARF
jgi:thiol-disulfide isomerase/thioredoxin